MKHVSIGAGVIAIVALVFSVGTLWQVNNIVSVASGISQTSAVAAVAANTPLSLAWQEKSLMATTNNANLQATNCNLRYLLGDDCVAIASSSVSVIAPAVNLPVAIGSAMDIKWVKGNIPAGVYPAIALINTSGSAVATIVDEAKKITGTTYSWTVPNNIPSGIYKVKVVYGLPAGIIYDVSVGTFNLTNGPSAAYPQFTIVSKTITSGQTSSVNGISTSTGIATFTVKVKAVGGDITFGTLASSTPMFASSTAGFKIYKNGVADSQNFIKWLAFDMPVTAMPVGLNSFVLQQEKEMTIQVSYSLQGRLSNGSLISAGAYSVGLESIRYVASGMKKTDTSMSGNAAWKTMTVNLP